METITVVYKFLQCPSTDIRRALREEGYEISTNSEIENAKKSQHAFSNEFDIPTIDLFPQLTQYKQLDNYSSEHRVWQVRNRYLFFDYGIVFWEVTFNTSLDTNLPRHFNKYIKIDGYNLLSNAIYRKTRLCTGTSKADKRCGTCETTNTYDDIRLVTTSNSKIHQTIKRKNGKKSKYEEYEVKGTKWVIRKIWQSLYVDRSNRSITSSLSDIIIISSVLPISIKYSGDEILSRLSQTLPPYTTVSSDITERVDNYIKHFLHRYFFTAPQFLLDKQNVRLHLSPTLLKCLNYAYTCYGQDKLWVPDQDIIQQVPESLLVINRLFILLHNIPHPLAKQLQDLFNPFNAAIPVGSQKLHQKLEQEHIKIVMIMSQHLVKSTKTNKVEPIARQSSTEPFSTSKLTESLGYARGRKNRYVQRLIDTLVEYNILIKTTPSEIGTTRGRASELYYLNPQLAYTQFCIQVVEHTEEEQIDMLISYLANNTTEHSIK